jgi:membrane fusion protein (multidrug efflux system)
MKKLFLLMLLATLAGCGENQRANRAPPAPVAVEMTVVERSPLVAHRIVTGSLQAVRLVRIFNQEEGRIVALPFYPGDRVEQAGTLIARIDDRLIQAQLRKARATLAQARLDVKRLRTLVKKRLTSEDELARAETALKLAEAEVSLLETRLDHTRITAPFPGVISERLKEPGDVAPLYTHILTLFDPGRLKVSVSVSELLLTHLQAGDPVGVRIDALGDARYPATVQRIYPTVDPRTRKGILEIHLDETPPGARPGQLCRITLDTRTSPRRHIPFAALRHDSQGEFVFRINATNQAEKIRVSSGILFGNQVEILEGLEVGDRVVVKGFLGLRDGAKVKPMSAGPAPANDDKD